MSSSNKNSTLAIVGTIIGIVVSCIAIFTFITGVSSLNLFVQVNQPSYQEPSQPEVSPNTNPPIQPNVQPNEPVVPQATPQIPSPHIYNFSACTNPCDGSNSTRNFSEALTKIYLQWDYENIPYGASYIRKWTMGGNEWIKYDCTWNGSESGHDSVSLTEPKGLHSGTWEVTIIVNGQVLLSEQIYISGNWDYWDPAGTLNSCYGTTN